jgi:hypothetical protein
MDPARSHALADRAESTVRSLASPFPQQQELSIMAEEMARLGDLDRAERLTLVLSEPYVRALTFGRIASAAPGDGDANRIRRFLDQAEALLGSITDPGIRARGLALIAKAAADVGAPERTAVLAMEAATAARSMIEPEDRVSVLTWAADALASAGQRDQASGLVAEAEAISWSIDEEAPRSSALRNLAMAVAQGGNVDRAAEIVESIPAPDTKTNALVDLARDTAAAGKVDRAETLARTIGDSHWRIQTLAIVAAARIRFGQLAEATLLANEVETTARRIANADTQAESSVVLSDALIQTNDRHRAALLAAQAATYAQLITLPMRRTPLLAKAAAAMVLAGDHERALTLVESAEDPERPPLISAVTQAMVRAGEVEHAETLVASITGPYAQIQAIARLAKDLADAGRSARASVLFETAEAAMRSIDQPRQLEDLRSCLAAAMAHVGELDQAETTARAIQNPFTHVEALVPIAEAATSMCGSIRTLAGSGRTRSYSWRDWRCRTLTGWMTKTGSAGPARTLSRSSRPALSRSMAHGATSSRTRPGHRSRRTFPPAGPARAPVLDATRLMELPSPDPWSYRRAAGLTTRRCYARDPPSGYAFAVRTGCRRSTSTSAERPRFSHNASRGRSIRSCRRARAPVRLGLRLNVSFDQVPAVALQMIREQIAEPNGWAERRRRRQSASSGEIGA